MTRVLVVVAAALGLFLAVVAGVLLHTAGGPSVGLAPRPLGVGERLVAPVAPPHTTVQSPWPHDDGARDEDD